MKKLILLSAMITVAMSSWAAKVGDKFTVGKFEYYVDKTASSSSSGEVSISKYTGSDASVFISYSVSYNGENFNIVGIRPFAFHDNTAMKSINFSKSIVETIYSSAFEGCTGLTSVDLPSSLKNFYGGAFYGCTNIATVTIPSTNSYYVVKDGVLYSKNMYSLMWMPAALNKTEFQREFAVPEQVNNIAEYAFAHNPYLKRVFLRYGVNRVGEWAFAYCNNLSFVSLPATVTRVGDFAFYGCKNIDRFAFNSKNPPVYKTETFSPGYLPDLHVPDGYADVYKQNGWSSFKSINEYDIVAADYMAYDKSLTYSVISDKPVTIGGVTYDGEVETVKGFYHERYLDEVPDYLTFTIEGVQKKYAVTRLGKKSFRKFPGTEYPVAGCKNVLHVAMSAFEGEGVTTISLPNVMQIGASAFKNCKKLESVNWGSGLGIVGDNAFEGSTLGGEVVLPYGFNILGASAFASSKITHLLIPSSCVMVGSNFAKGAKSLTEIVINTTAGAAPGNTYDFTGVASSCSVYVPYGSLNTFYGHSGWKNLTLKNGAYDFTYGKMSDRNNSIYHMTVVDNTPVTVDGKTYAGTAKYVYHPNIETATAFGTSGYERNQYYGVDKSYLITEIDYGCFRNATGIKTLNTTYMTGLKTIGSLAFEGSGITSLVVPATVTTIKDYAFHNATSLSSLTILPRMSNLTLEGQLYGNNANGFRCYVHYNDLLNYFNQAKNWTDTSTSALKDNLNPFIVPDHKTMALGVCVPVDFAASGVNAYVVKGNNMGTSGTGTVATTEKVTSVPASTGVILTGLTPGKRYLLERPAGSVTAPKSNRMTAVATEGDYAVMPASGNYVWSELYERLDKPEMKSYVPSGSAYYVPDVTPSFSEIYLDILPKQGGGVKGDVDGNGVVDITDANILINVVLGKDSATKYGGRADVDGNGVVDIMDVNISLNIILGK
ncbi:leucine-rich repeat protein [Sodaliphilus sp.]|uniref:leucine-rich repeat protein n=1 Tax=Sodaliphilus sp. TaxID=2815818 RepID=UPI00388D5FCD